MNDTPQSPDRIDHLLALLQKALGHDLPNQLLAIQGLARQLEMDQTERLDDEGKDYLCRLAAAARRTHDEVRGLADLVRAERSVKALLPGQAVEYHGRDSEEPPVH